MEMKKPGTVKADPKKISKHDILEIAQRIRNIFFVDTKSVERNLEAILSQNKIITCWFADDNFINLFEIKKGLGTICLPFCGQTTAGNNYGIARALGHFFLHVDMSKSESMCFARNGDPRQRMEATWFAAELLMPRLELIRVGQELKNNHYHMAMRFEVDPTIMKNRLESLGLRTI